MDPKGNVRPEEAEAELFVRQVKDALASLHDLPHLQSHPLAARLLPRPSTTEPTAQARLLQQRLLDAIEHLRPVSVRLYDLLRLRYVEGLDVRAVYERLDSSKSDYYRQLRLGQQAIAAHLEAELMSGLV